MLSHLKKNMVNVKLNLTDKTSHITASPQQIGQVIMNLVNNAIKFFSERSKNLSENVDSLQWRIEDTETIKEKFLDSVA